MSRTVSRGALSVLATTLMLVGLLVAGDRAPAAESCAPLLIADPAGDQIRELTGTPADPAGPANLDIVGADLAYTDKLRARIKVTNLTKAVPQGANASSWYMQWESGDTGYWVRAVSNGTDVTYAHGTINPTTGGYTGATETTGSFTEGTGGQIEIIVPAAAQGTLGKTLTTVYATAFETAVQVALQRIGFASLSLGRLAEGQARRLRPHQVERLWKDADV